jgi:hypothetical protein
LDEPFNPLDREPLLSGRLLKQQKCRKGLPVDVLALEDRVHLFSQRLQLPNRSLLHVGEIVPYEGTFRMNST